jgi:hypothetical protein
VYARVCLCSFIWTCLQTQERDEIAAVKATTCCISSSPLQDHVAAGAAGIVCCELGFLYSKEALLAHIVEKKVPEKFSHVKSMKDVTEVKLTLKSQEGADNRHGATATAAGGMIYQEAPFQCPVTSRDMNGFNRFCVIRCSGAAVSLDAIKQLSCCPEADGSILCPLTSKPFDPNVDLILIYPDGADIGAASVASFLAAVLTAIYLCNVCSCQEILRRNGRG